MLISRYKPLDRRNAKKRRKAQEMYIGSGIKRAVQLYHRGIDMNGGAGLAEKF